jgi:hypothetical protein
LENFIKEKSLILPDQEEPLKLFYKIYGFIYILIFNINFTLTISFISLFFILPNLGIGNIGTYGERELGLKKVWLKYP